MMNSRTRKFISTNLWLLNHNFTKNETCKKLLFKSLFIFLVWIGNAGLAQAQEVTNSVERSSTTKIRPLSAWSAEPEPGSIWINRDAAYNTLTPEELIMEVFFKGGGGTCVTEGLIENVKFYGTGWDNETLTWTSTNTQARSLVYFSNGTLEGLGIEKGLLLSTGSAMDAEGPNEFDDGLAGGSNTVTDTDLAKLVNEKLTTGSVLEFDFTPQQSEITFEYVFASEEYPEFANDKYNDVFAFFISGEGIDGTQNIALLPGTQIPVTINNVNGGYAEKNTPESYENAKDPQNSEYFVRNYNETGQYTEYDGHTVVLTARADVIPKRKYHLKLAIANVFDTFYGSGVFLKAGSFDIGFGINNQVNGKMSDEVYQPCEDNKFTLNINTRSVATEVNLSYSGIAADDLVSPDGTALPTSITFPANVSEMEIPYKVKDTMVGGDFTIQAQIPGCGDPITKTIQVYTGFDNPVITTKPTCDTDGEISVNVTSTNSKFLISLDGNQWQSIDTPFTGLSYGDHLLYIKDELDCQTMILTATIPGPPEQPEITPTGVNAIYSNATLTLNCIPDATAYQWYKDGQPISGATSKTYIAESEGRYAVQITNEHGCVSVLSEPTLAMYFPDNISDADCYVEPETTNWKPVLRATTSENVHILAQPFVGDIDGDGKLEVVTTNFVSSGYATSNEILIFDNELKLKKRFTTPTICANTATPIVLVRLPGEKEALIIVAVLTSGAYKLQAYRPDGKMEWESNSSYFINSTSITASVCLVAGDINNDGIPEILAVDGIFDAATGKLLATLPAGGRGYRLLNGSASNHTYMPALADIDNDGKLEVISGNTTYKVDIQDRNDPTKNKATILATAKHTMGDGYVSIADIDLDGQPDVIVVTQGTSPSVTVWNGVTGDIIAGPKSPTVTGGGGSRAFIGDVDQDGYPEIFFSYVSRLVGFDYDPKASTTAGKLVEKWNTYSTDTSGGTTLSMFDFDQSGSPKLVYRDEENLRIIDGIDGNDKMTIPCFSATHSEYPIVVDFDGDGHADILVSGAASKAAQVDDVRIYWFTGESNDWAPARKVWNQHGYNSIHVNEDLTIPKYQLNPSTVFKGEDGQKTIRPYNGYLLQQTVLSKNGETLFLTPNAQIESPENIIFDYDREADILTISGLKITNIGSAPLNAPVSIAVYKEAAADGNNISLTGYGTAGTFISVNETVTVNPFKITNFSSNFPLTKLVIKVNDNGKNEKVQPTCEDCDPTDSDIFSGVDLNALAWADPYRNCVGGNVVFESSIANAATYEWIYPDGTSFNETTKKVEKSNLQLSEGGHYTFKATGVNGNLNLTYKLPYLSVAPATMYWRQDAEDNNWNNINNWATTITGTPISAVPAPCTSVHIPGVADNFPSLDETTTPTNIYGKPEVDNITFHYKSELVHQHKLIYNKAFVQYNFGYYNGTSGIVNADRNYSPVLNRDKWYVLAAPLKKVASGDFALAGYPFSWQAKHEVASIGNGKLSAVHANAHAKNDVDLQENAYNSISLKMAGNSTGTGYNNHKNLEGLKGIIELPYFENDATGEFHASHSYDKFTGESSFYYYNTNTLQQVHSPVGSMKRGQEAYRFVYEDENGNVPTYDGTNPGYTLKVTAPAGSERRVLIGNPFLSSINASRFFQANQSAISGNTYLVYNSTSEAWESISYNDTTYTHINSFQSFIVTLNTESATLYFPLEGQYALTEAGEVANVPTRGIAALEIAAIDSEGNGEKAQLTTATHSNITRSEEKVVSMSEQAVPEVFFVDNQANKYNLIQLYNKDIAELGIGVKAKTTGTQLTLNFANVDDFVFDSNVEQLVLVDKLTGTIQDITRNTQYSFIHKGNPVDGQYIDTDRFVLKMADTAITNSENITIYYLDKAIYVDGMDVNYVHVFDISGTKLCELSKSELSYVPLNQGVYIVKAFAKDGKQKTSRIMVK